MSVEVLILVVTAVLAVVAIGAAVVAVRAARRIAQPPARPVEEPVTRRPATVVVREPSPGVAPPAGQELEPRVVEGRLVVPPTQEQVVQTALGRPGVRLSVFVHGAAYALRAESRDRIAALMRREYRRRRRERLQAGRRAVRSAQPPAASDEWLGGS
ncbi:MAG: hypothetical protein JWR55_2683 [Aeromicrobium sp.]|jgi:hypothetical protein|nr:hypothetical protein [Aeromicrobium sp.]